MSRSRLLAEVELRIERDVVTSRAAETRLRELETLLELETRAQSRLVREVGLKCAEYLASVAGLTLIFLAAPQPIRTPVLLVASAALLWAESQLRGGRSH